MVSQAELKKRRVKAGKAQIRQEQVVDRRDRRRRFWTSIFIVILALALIAPLAAGLFLDADDGQDTQPDPEPIQLTETTPPSLIDPGFAGASITGETPCPAVDGSQERTTSFEQAPAGCIDPTAAYSVELGTIAGPIEIDLDPAGEPVATDLFVSLARYGIYEGLPILTEFPGVVVLGNFGDAGFNITLDESPANAEYPVGSIVLLTELGTGALTGQAAIITTEAGAELIANDGGTSPIIGAVTTGDDALTELVRLGAANPETTYRLREATVTETTG
ncbi:MAG: hypothetical protein AAGA90_23045 [Actinomycetota bacterium]